MRGGMQGNQNERQTMSTGTTTTGPAITQLEFEESDFAVAERMAKRLGYTQTAYTTSSALWGLFCLRDRPKQHAACIIKTREFGLMAVMSLEDLNMGE